MKNICGNEKLFNPWDNSIKSNDLVKIHHGWNVMGSWQMSWQLRCKASGDVPFLFVCCVSRNK